MKIQSLHIQNFTVFEDQKFDFCDGVNIFIGANATGKTHVLKAMYVLPQAKWVEDASDAKKVLDSDSLILFNAVFCTAERRISHLIRHPNVSTTKDAGEKERAEKAARIKMKTDFGPLDVSIGPPIDSTISKESACFVWSSSAPENTPAPLFFPPREMLSAYEGFAALYEKREISFDKTYPDICRHLAVPVLREERLPDLISGLTDILGGSVIEKGGRFYVKQPAGRLLEAHLLAEGHRKLAMLVRLVTNGEIEKDTVLLWDEPEAGLNPVLITKVAKAIRQLAAAGVQVFLATHDALLTGELSLVSEYEKGGPPMRFFAFHRENERETVKIEVGDTIADLPHNPIVEEFAAHYHRERAAFYGKALAEGK